MNQAFSLLILLFLFTSCASVLNKPFTQTTIYTSVPAGIIIQRDTIETAGNIAKGKMERRNKPVKIIILSDCIEKL